MSETNRPHSDKRYLLAGKEEWEEILMRLELKLYGQRLLSLVLVLCLVLPLTAVPALANGHDTVFLPIQPLDDGFATIATFSDIDLEPATPNVDLLLAAYNVLGGETFTRSNISVLWDNPNRPDLHELSHMMHFRGGPRGTYTFQSAHSIEHLASMRQVDLGFSMNTDIGVNSLFKVTAGASFHLNRSRSEMHNFSNSYENFFSMMDLSRRVGRNTIQDLRHLEHNEEEIWQALSPRVREALLGYDYPPGWGGMRRELDIYTHLFNAHGTHIITSYNFGGRAEHFTSIIKIESTAESSIREELERGQSINFSYSGVGGSVRSNHSIYSNNLKTV